MKKLLSLLMLFVAIVTGAQATDFTLYGSSSAPSLPITTDGITVSGTSTGSKNGSNQVSDVATAAGIPSTKIYMISFSSGGMLTIDAGAGKKITSITMVVGRNSSGNSVSQFGHGGFSTDNSTWSEITSLSAKGYDYGTTITVNPTGSYRYYSFGRGKLGNTSPSANAEARVYKLSVTVASVGPSITTQPQSASYTTGQTIAALTVVATPTTSTYQWYSCDDADKTNAAAIENETSASYTPTAAGFYYVAVTDGGVTVNSDVAQITVSEATAPTINVTGAPASAVKVGTEVMLTATATGVPTPTITWYDGNDQSVATVEGTELAYTVPTTTAGTYTFYAKATNGVGNDATSAVQTVVVKEQVVTPTFTPNGANFQESQEVAIACTTADATIQYSTDGGENWTNYTAAFTVTETTTVQAKAVKDGCIDSETASATFTKFEKSDLTSISAAATWDFTKVTATLQLTANTTPTKDDDYYTIDDIATINNATIPSTFGDATTIAFKGEYPYRNKKSQAGYWKFNTTVAGTIKVTFSDTGSTVPTGGAVKRYLNINGVNTEYYTQRDGTADKKTTDEIVVPAGDVVITSYGEDGETWQAIVVEKIVFTPATTTTVTLNSNGYATYSKATDFVFSGAQAYKMNLNYTAGTLEGTKVTGKIQAGEGILFKGTAGATVTIAETTGASAQEDNSLVGTTPATGDAPTPDYTSYKYFVLKGKSFVPYTTATTFGAGKAFFQVDIDAQLPASLELAFDGEATAINTVNANDNANSVAPVKVIKNGKLYIGNYNVAGQLVK